MNVISDKASSISWQSLCANYNYFAHLLVVSTKLGLECLKTASRLGLKEAIHIARHHYQKEFPPVATTVTVENLAELLSEVLKDVPPHHLDRSEDEESLSASEVEPEPEKTKKIKKSKNQKNPKKLQKPKKPEEKGGRSHHVEVKCRIHGCSVKVFDIRRHLLTHVKRKKLHADDVNTYAEIMRHGKQKTLISSSNPKKGKKTSVHRRKKWCPMPQCNTICVRMEKHLQNVHHLKIGTVPYKVHLKEAKPYRGVMELDDHPRSVLAKEPSTSSAAPQQTEAADCEDDSSSDGATNICPPSVSESDSEAHSEAHSESTSSDSVDCGPSNMTNLKYLTSKTFTSARHKWLCGFFQYLGLPDAGYLKESQRLQHASQIKILLETLAPDEDDLEYLGAENGDAVWVRWVDPHLQNKSKAPGTLTSYLTSLQMFLTYLTGRKYHPMSMPSLSPFLKDIFIQMIPALKGWRACIDSFSQDSQLRKYIAECDALITNEDIARLTRSKPYLEGASNIDLADTGATITRRQFTLVRDYLLCRLTLATGTRPGALNNVLLSDYETSRVSEGNRIILVPKHKRTKDGPAMLGLDPLMQKEMATYVSKIRPAFAIPGEEKLFVKDDGAEFPEGTIGKRVVAFFERSGVTSTRVGHTHIRKFMSTQTHEKGNEEEGHTVEKVMSHGQQPNRDATCGRTAPGRPPKPWR